MHIDARTEVVLGAAMRMIVRNGVHGATIEEIATGAGLSVGVTEMLHKLAPQAK